MSPEERAQSIGREIAARVKKMNPSAGQHEALIFLVVEFFAAPAIREAQASARNEALEEAADSATKFLVGDPFNGVPLRSPGPHEVAAHILTLKTKD